MKGLRPSGVSPVTRLSPTEQMSRHVRHAGRRACKTVTAPTVLLLE
jgi:hypothetical protein